MFILGCFMVINLCGCVLIMGALAQSAKAKQSLNVPYGEALEMVKGALKTTGIRFESAVVRSDITEVKGQYVDGRTARILISKVSDNEALIAVRVGTSVAGKKDAQQILEAIINYSVLAVKQ